MMLVTLEQARGHLRSDQADDDSDLTLKIKAASASVFGYLGSGGRADWTDSGGYPFEDSNGIAIGVPDVVQMATLLTVAWLSRERSGSQEYAVPSQFGYGFQLPQGATALLFPLREHGIA